MFNIQEHLTVEYIRKLNISNTIVVPAIWTDTFHLMQSTLILLIILIIIS